MNNEQPTTDGKPVFEVTAEKSNLPFINMSLGTHMSGTRMFETTAELKRKAAAMGCSYIPTIQVTEVRESKPQTPVRGTCARCGQPKNHHNLYCSRECARA